MRRIVLACTIVVALVAGVLVAYARGHVPARSPRALPIARTFDMVPGETVTVDGSLELTFVETTWGTATPALRHRLFDASFSVRRARLRAREGAERAAFEINDGVWSGLDARRVGSHWVEFVDGAGDRIRLRVVPFPDPPKVGRDEACAIALRASQSAGFDAKQAMNAEQRGDVWRVEVVGTTHDRARVVFVSADDGRVLDARDVSRN